MTPSRQSLARAAAATALLALTAGGAQALQLQLITGTASGSHALQVLDAQAASVNHSGGLTDASGVDSVAALGADALSGQALGSGSVSHSWARSASLYAPVNPSAWQFSTSSSSQTDLAGAINGAALSLSGGVLLSASLRIVGDGGEATGTPVRLTLQGLSDALIGISGLPSVDALPSFSLAIRDAGSQLLAGWSGFAGVQPANHGVQFNAAVGDTLDLQLSLDDSAIGLGDSLAGGQTGSLSVSSLVEGSLSVSAVPEPQVWALLAAGLGMVARRASRARGR